MATKKTPASILALQQSTNGLGDNMGLENRAVADSDQFYRGQEAKDFGNVQATAEDWRQHGAAIAPGDPQGFRALMQAMAEKNAHFGPGTNFTTNTDVASPNGNYGDVQQFDSALPVPSLVALKQKVRR